MRQELAETGDLQRLLTSVGGALDRFLRFEHPDAMAQSDLWKQPLDVPLPEQGVGMAAVTRMLTDTVIPNGSCVPRPGFTSYITTGGTTAATLACAAASVASPQRYGLTAFNLLEELSLRWLAEMCHIGPMHGVYSSGGSTANLVALGAARQFAFERAGCDPAADGVHRPARIYATREAHHTVQRSAGVLGLGRQAVHTVACDDACRMDVGALRRAIEDDRQAGLLPMAIVANAGTTNTGSIDPIDHIAAIARAHGIWLHVDGAYGLPGVLDERKQPLFRGLEHADSVIVDPHKWLGAPTGVAATFVKDQELLRRAFMQEPADYLEGTVAQATTAAPAVEHSLDGFGIPYFDLGVELSAPCRGAMVWALIQEIGVQGMRARIVRHNDMAQRVAEAARNHPNLELLIEPTLSICCFRYIAPGVADLDSLNRLLHRRLIRENRNLPSTTQVGGRLAIRPCFIGARTEAAQADELVADVLRIGAQVAAELAATP